LLKYPEQSENKPLNKFNFISTEILIIFLMMAIALRSAIWDIYQIIHYGNYSYLIWIGLAASAGKITGGFMADRAGWKVYTVIALLSASIFLSFSEKGMIFLLFGVAFLQSVTGVGVAAMSALIPDKPATAAGLTLGLAIALGGVPFFLGLNGRQVNSFSITLSLLLVLVFYLSSLNPFSQREKGLEE
jgi:hypothetical protein